MARKKRNMDSREVGLVMGLIFGRYFFHTDDLHYGLWPDDLDISPDNIKQAQENHSDLILSNIPAGVRTILDVGCGAGALAKRLLENGYEVEGVSPSSILTEQAHKTVGPDFKIYSTPFEQFQSDKQYDLICFSESYQYIKIDASLKQCANLLKPDGYMMICDFFRRPGMKRGPIGGGHKWDRFEAILADHPFSCLLDMDITKETARNYDLVNGFMQDVGVPVWTLIFRYFAANYPRMTRLGRRIFRKRIEKLEQKYFSGQRTSETFIKYKHYRLLLYQKT